MQEFVLKKLLAKTKVGNLGKAQLKIAASALYYTLLGVMGLVTHTHFDASSDFRERIIENILCENDASLPKLSS